MPYRYSVLLLTALALISPLSFAKQQPTQVAVDTADTQNYVNQQMSQSIAEINSAMNQLVLPYPSATSRKADPIGSTVAGAAAPVRTPSATAPKSLPPIATQQTVAATQSPVAQSAVARTPPVSTGLSAIPVSTSIQPTQDVVAQTVSESVQVNEAGLLSIVWNGNISDLLQQIASASGYRYIQPAAFDRNATVVLVEVPFETALNVVATQLGGKADIQVSKKAKSIALAVR